MRRHPYNSCLPLLPRHVRHTCSRVPQKDISIPTINNMNIHMQYPSLSCISTQAYLVLLVKKSLLPASFSKEILVWRYFEDYNCFLLFRWVSREVHHWKERRSAGKTSVSKHNTKLLTSSTPECFSIQALYYFPSFWINPLQRNESQSLPFFQPLGNNCTNVFGIHSQKPLDTHNYLIVCLVSFSR